ncbi:MAG: PTS sugar transporter subunit IIA [Treponema sp.]|nr:PTS sugar transporter subunit IIA [Candidatus Treponema equi]
MIDDNYSVASLVSKGDVIFAEGDTVEEIFVSALNKADLPDGITAASLVEELMAREKVLSTAVGNGIAIPHPRRPLVASNDECRVIVVYASSPIDMQAPDFRKVYAMFILLSDSSQFHIKALSSLAKIFKNEEFRKGLMMKPAKAQLVDMVKKCEE